MEIVKVAQCWKSTGDEFHFSLTRVLFRQDGILFAGQTSARQFSPGDELENITPIPDAAWQPIAPPGCTIAPDPDSSDVYIKQPNLSSFGSIDLADLVLNELSVCEIIKRHPHPNIATYHGCFISDGRVTGLCFDRYQETLQEKINPGSLNKSMFIQATDRKQARESATAYLPGIEAGIKHLHSLGIIHNDINPANVMISEDNVPVIIDFDSCSVIGTDFRSLKRGTHGWFDIEVEELTPSNDLDALQEMRVYLMGSAPEEFHFKEF